VSLSTDPGRAATPDREGRPAQPHPPRPGTVLAIDGGNSKTDAILVDDHGRVIAAGRAGGFTPQITGVPAALEAAAEAVEQIRAQLVASGMAAGAAGGADGDGVGSGAGAGGAGAGGGANAGGGAGGGGGTVLARHLSAYVAGADLEVEERILADAFRARGWADTLEVGNDTFALLRAGAGGPGAVAVVCGDGINCAGIGPDGRRARFPSLGSVTGDWGGGSHLGMKTLGSAVRGEDGRGPRTGLSAAVAAHFDRSTAEQVAIAIHLGEIDAERIRELSPVLMQTAEHGDQVAEGLVSRMAEEIVTMAWIALSRLGLERSEAAVILGGGVLRAEPPALMTRIRLLAAERFPSARLVIVRGAPVHGAARLGLDTLGLTPRE
jgi:N-acetylglucosamine kinase-like BadF-type ATPase